MTQLLQLSETQVDDRFRLTAARPIAFMLAGFARDNVPFSVLFQAGKEMFLTTLLAVQADKGLLIFDCSGSQDTNRLFMASERQVFVGRPGGIHVQFSCGTVSEMIYGGSKAFSVALPKTLVRLQRREFFRIETPLTRPLLFFGRLPDGHLLSLAVHDISVNGLSLSAPSLPPGLSQGLVLANCHFALAGEPNELFFAVAVRHQTELELRAGSRQWRIGLTFQNLSGNDENRIQRYIARVERERHELS